MLRGLDARQQLGYANCFLGHDRSSIYSSSLSIRHSGILCSHCTVMISIFVSLTAVYGDAFAFAGKAPANTVSLPIADIYCHDSQKAKPV